jgi:hypothetical protein
MRERRLGLGWNAVRRRCWCEEGLIRADKARFTKSPPSTPPILTSEFVIADLRRLRWYDAVFCWWPWSPPRVAKGEALCREHRNEPGCVVGEHAHAFFLLEDTALLLPCFLTEIEERPGEVAPSIENLTEDDGDGEGDFDGYGEGEHERCPCKFTGVEERVKNVDDREAKLEHDEANADEDE